MAVTEDDLRRANELAHRAIQDAAAELDRRRTGARRQARDPGDLLEHARDLVGAARQIAASARAMQQHADNQRGVRKDAPRSGPPSAKTRNFLAAVTWGRRKARCASCGQRIVVTYRCTAQKPLADCELPCPAGDCGAAVTCSMPSSAFGFQVRAASKAGG